MVKKRLKHYFIPHEGNVFKPHFLERFSMGIMLLLVLLTFAIANLGSLVWISSDWLVSSILPAVIVDLTNEERVDDKLITLSRNDVLDRAAQMKAEHMARNEYFAHYSPDGTSPWYWFDEAGYSYAYAGENLAVHFTDSEDVVEGWMNSPTHRANIMSGEYTEIGVGTARGKYKGAPTIFVVQLFGTPKQTSVAVVETSEPEQVLAQAEIIEESIPTETPDVLAEEIAVEPEVETPSEETLISEESTHEEMAIPEEVVEPEQIEIDSVLYSQMATRSPDAVPALSQPQVPPSSGGLSLGFLAKSTTQPHVWMQFLYAIFATMVVVALSLSIIIEWRRQNPVQIAYATSLLLLMGILMEAHTLLTSGVIIV